MASETPLLLDSTLHYSLRKVAHPAHVTVVRNADPNSTTWCYFRVHNGQWWHKDTESPYIDIPYDPTTHTGNTQADFRALLEQVAMAAHLITPVGAK